MCACFVKGSDGIFFKPTQNRMRRDGKTAPMLGICTHIASEEDRRFAERLGGILRPDAPKKDNGSGVESPEPLCSN